MKEFTITTPLRYKHNKTNILYSLNNFMIPVGTDKAVNTYWLKRAKDHLFKVVKDQCKDVEQFKDRVDITITIYRGSNHLCDMGNFCIVGSITTEAVIQSGILCNIGDLCIVEKFTTDAVVQAGLLADDNWKFIRSIELVDGGLDKGNERAEYHIQVTE